MQLTKIIARAAIYLGVLIAFVLCAARFVAAANGDFWYDEIWSWMFARDAQAPGDIVTKFRHDNNHMLNTGIIAAIGQSAHWFWYRLPAVVAGIGAIFSCAWLARPLGRDVANLCGFLAATSYLMIHYSTEARGYAYLLLLAPLSVCLLRAAFDRGRMIWAILFAGVAISGFFAHATYYICYLGCIGYSIAELYRRWPRWGDWLRISLGCHVAPCVCATWLYFVHYQNMAWGGGPEPGLQKTLVQFFSLIVGSPSGKVAAWLMAGAALTLIGFGVWRICRGDVRWITFFGLLIPVHLLLCLTRSSATLHCRYFLVWLPFFLMALAMALVALARFGRWGRVGFITCALTIFVGNLAHTTYLLRYGRGGYFEAIGLITSESTSHDLTITAQDLQVGHIFFPFYLPHLKHDKEVLFYPTEHYPPAGVEWVILTSPDDWNDQDSTIADNNGHYYRLVKSYPHAKLSGCTFAVFRRVPDEPR